jgi:hypothetical protein
MPSRVITVTLYETMSSMLLGRSLLPSSTGSMVSLSHHIDMEVANEVEDKPDVHSYPYGSRGPEGLEEFTSKFGHYKRVDDD